MTRESDISTYWETTPDSLVVIRDAEYYTPFVQEWLINEWCRDNQIQARRYKGGAGLDEWTVKNPDDRVLFALRWGTGTMTDDHR